MPVKREGDIAVTGVVDRVTTANGELVLRRDGEHFEIISNGTFLMDTRGGASERLLVRAAVAAAGGAAGDGAPTGTSTGTATESRTGLRVLVGGLGVGFSLGEAAAHPAVGHVTVVEREAPVIAWQRGPLAPFSGHALDDPKVEVRHADLVVWAHAADAGAASAAGEVATEAYDALCLDIDNGPDWTVTDSNRSLYGEAGLRALCRRLAPGGVLAVWSAAASPEFETRLGTVFTGVRAEEIPVRVPRGLPDVVYLARKPAS